MIATPASGTQHIAQQYPQLRPDIVFGPPELSRGTTIYYMKDRFTNWFYRVGVKEYFILSRMNGNTSLQQIGAEYEAQFGRRLDNPSWQGMFKLLTTRQLLVGSSQSDLEAMKSKAANTRRQQNRSPFRWRFPLLNPDSFLEKLLPWLRFAFHPAFVFLALAAIITLEIFVLLHGGAIVTDALAGRTGADIIPLTALFVVLSLLFAAFHEFAHALACKRFGGSVREIGIVWRYLSFFPYCKIDDIVLFHNRWHRVYAAFAGTFISLLLLIPFGFLWACVPDKSFLRDVSAWILLALNIQALLNFVPFVELDGYFMLSHALDMIDLRKEAHEFWLKGLQKILFKKGEGTKNYARRGKKIYLIYGLCSLLFTAYFVVFMGYFWFIFARQWLGNLLALTILCAFALLLIVYKYPGTKTLLDRYRKWRASLLSGMSKQTP